MPDDSVRAALYYPHTGVRTLELLKAGLLLWDTVEYIAPHSRLQPDPPGDAPVTDAHLVHEAMELLLVRHVPTHEERDRAHETVKLIVHSDLADWLQKIPTANTAYLIYPQKFLPKTWRLLEESRLARVELKDPDQDYSMSRVLGLILMSVLADACAGTRRRMVTDQQAAYSIVRESILKNTVVATADDCTAAKLIDVTLRAANLKTVPLKDLVELRKRELKEGAGSSLTALRRGFATRLDAAAQSIAAATSKTDRKRIQNEFEHDMKADLALLSKDLRGLAWDVVFSREFGAGVLIGAGLWTIPGGQAVAGTFALTGAGLAYRRKRLEALEKHPMSWIYTQKQLSLIRRLTFR